MSWGVMASPRSCPLISRVPSIARSSSNRSSISLNFATIGVRCKCIGDSGGNESKTVLDAFFLGKALGEVLNERVESGLGEFLGVIGRLQADQQKHLFEFQEEVLEKARQAKEQASDVKGQTPVSGVPNSTSSESDKDPFIGLLKD